MSEQKMPPVVWVYITRNSLVRQWSQIGIDDSGVEDGQVAMYDRADTCILRTEADELAAAVVDHLSGTGDNHRLQMALTAYRRATREQGGET